MTIDPKKYRVSPDTLVEDDDTDLDTDPITLPGGTVLDEKTAAALGRATADRAAERRGRPSLTGQGAASPQVSTRLPIALRQQLDAIAQRDGVKPAEVLRRALEEYVDTHR